MPIGRNSRVGRRSSSCGCPLTATLVVFVAFCLIVVWLMTPSNLLPVNNHWYKWMSESKEHATGTESFSFGFGSNVALDTDTDVTIGTSGESKDSSQGHNAHERTTGNPRDKTQGVSAVNDNEESEDESADTRNNFGIDENYQEQKEDINHDLSTNSEQGKKASQSSDGISSANQNKNLDEQQNSDSQKNIDQGQLEENIKRNQNSDLEHNPTENNPGSLVNNHGSNVVIPDGAQLELLKETNAQNGAWSTQDAESTKEKEVQGSISKGKIAEFSWKLCNVTAGADYIPCLDNEEAIKNLHSTKHYEHRERHCPKEAPTCLVRLPDGYKQPIRWPKSRDMVWYKNVPHTHLAVLKGHQNWVKVTGEYLTFPGGGTQFKHGALHYIDRIQEALPDLAWGKRSRVVLDVGCGVASFGGYLFDRDVLTMSFAPKDEHEAQVQFALERGIPAISAVMGTKRLPFPSKVFDVIHCARCRVPWHIEGGMLLLELNRLLRPGGFFVWSATPVYRKDEEDVGIWNAMSVLTKSICWKLVTKTNDKVNQVGLAIYRKPLDNTCYDKRKENKPPLCQESDDPDAAWNVPLQACIHRLPVEATLRSSHWPEEWPQRLEKTPYWLTKSEVGVYGKTAPEDFQSDYAHWKRVVTKSYINGMGIKWSTVRNVMDMSSVYGGFAAALRGKKVWVMNVVSVDSPDTLPIIYERGLFGMYHDWCESFSTYPRSYDLLHADHLFSKLKKRCNLLAVMAEVDRILRPEGNLIVRDKAEIISEVESITRSLHWEIRLTYSKDNEGLLCIQKTSWRPREVDSSNT